jgi:hypothetical protein
MITCPDCGSDDLSWDYTLGTSIPAGGLSDLHDVSVVFFIGCQECSATVKTASARQVVILLDTLLKEDML